jgi:hypothetical protein
MEHRLLCTGEADCAITAIVAQPEERRFPWKALGPVPEAQRHAKTLEVLQRLRTERGALERWVAVWVVEARAYGSTWAEIGAALGVTAQAVSKKYGGRAAEGNNTDERSRESANQGGAPTNSLDFQHRTS